MLHQCTGKFEREDGDKHFALPAALQGGRCSQVHMPGIEHFITFFYDCITGLKPSMFFLYLHCILTRHQIPSKPTLLPLTPTSS